MQTSIWKQTKIAKSEDKKTKQTRQVYNGPRVAKLITAIRK